MVLNKRLDYGFNGYKVPPTPRATRSARRRVPFKKKPEDNQMGAFDLLAIVAGKLLHEGENTSRSSNTSGSKDQCAVVNNTVKTEWRDEEKPMKVEPNDQGSPASSFFVSELLSKAHEQNSSSKESLCARNDLNLRLASAVTSDHAGRANTEKLVNVKNKNEMGTFPGKVEAGSSVESEFSDSKLECETKRIIKDDPDKFGNTPNSTAGNTCGLENPVVLNGKPPTVVHTDNCSKFPLSTNHISYRSYPDNQDGVDVVCRDDDENFSGCTHPRTTKKFFRPAPRIGDRRIRKILASKYWKVAPRLKDATLSNADGDMKPVYRNKKNYYNHQRSEKLYPFKKRRHFDYNSPSNSNRGTSCEFLDKKGNDGGTGLSSSVAGQHSSFQSRDSHVNLRIKSFRVPELFIEIPESATVGSLKRTVMEAVTAILGGGLRVGVLLQGKKVRDDSKTLLQTGISRDKKLEALGFSLEPTPPQASPSLCPKDSPFLLPCDAMQPLSRYASTPSLLNTGNCASPEPHVENAGNLIESDHDSAPSPTYLSVDKCTSDSKALVAVPAMNVEALAVVPPHRKSKRSEIVQRRIRRPFSVVEVEALVQAVEKLGTGRWRDVKLRAFDNAKHRTYVDLKDKWKTLVHTARISPQQRRGEPVPQELLDRVLTAHAYWSQQQAKQQLKLQQPPEACLCL